MPGEVLLVYDEAYMAYRHADWHPLQPRRVKLAVEQIRACGLDRLAALPPPPMATHEELAPVHSSEYIDLVRRLGHGEELSRPDMLRAVAAGFNSGDNPVLEQMHEAS